MKPWKIISGVGCILLIVLLFTFYRSHPLSATVMIKGTTFVAQTAVTATEKELGLGLRPSLAPKHGMLFIYDHKEVYTFWMKGMQFPLDFLWLDGNEIVDITKNVQPSKTEILDVVKPTRQVDKVLEINAGEADTYGIVIGDRVVFNK